MPRLSLQPSPPGAPASKPSSRSTPDARQRLHQRQKAQKYRLHSAEKHKSNGCFFGTASAQKSTKG